MLKKFWLIPLALLLASSIPTTAYGRNRRGHENCNLCHLAVEEGKYNLTIKPNLEVINPSTGQAFNEEDALCMRCHKMQAKSIHPVGIVPDPQKVVLPPEARGKGGRITCASCHDFHEENKNYRYLRWASNGRKDISQFCTAYCHVRFAAPASKSMRLNSHLALHK